MYQRPPFRFGRIALLRSKTPVFLIKQNPSNEKKKKISHFFFFRNFEIKLDQKFLDQNKDKCNCNSFFAFDWAFFIFIVLN